MIEVFKAMFIGIIEGVTEWLPISSTTHILLANEFLNIDVSTGFKDVFNILIQFGAMMALLVLFWNRLWPFTTRTDSSAVNKIAGPIGIKRASSALWLKIIVACIPSAVFGFLLKNYADKLNDCKPLIASTLIIYGVAFIILEALNKNKEPKIPTLHTLSYKTAFLIGCFQILALIPGTSRTGITILCAMLFGASRPVAAEFSFFIAFPTIFGVSLLKIIEHGLHFSSLELVILFAGMLSAFLVAILVIKFLFEFIKKHTFAAFGYYRVILGIFILVYYSLIG